MNKYGFILLLTLGLPWVAARAEQAPRVPPPVRIGPLRFEEVNFWKECGHCKGGPCVTASITTLKIVSAENAQAAAKLNAAIAGWVLRLAGGRVAKNPQEVVDEFVKDHCDDVQEGAKSFPEAFFAPWDDASTVKIEYQSARVLSLSLLGSEYSGGAHGQESLTYANFRPATGERLRLTDIFKERFDAPLNAIGERRLRELYRLGAHASLKETDIVFSDGQFELNENFSIGADGLTFYFQTHEITADNVPVKLLLPYADIRNLLRPDARIP
jgi:hypothetical protein